MCGKFYLTLAFIVKHVARLWEISPFLKFYWWMLSSTKKNIRKLNCLGKLAIIPRFQ